MGSSAGASSPLLHPGAWMHEAHPANSEQGLHRVSHPALCSWSWMNSPENRKMSQHCSFFQKFCFVYLHFSVQKIHPKGNWGLCPLDWKWCRRSEQVWGEGRRESGLPVMVIQLVPTAEFSLHIDLEEGERKGVRCRSSWEFLIEENLLLYVSMGSFSRSRKEKESGENLK